MGHTRRAAIGQGLYHYTTALKFSADLFPKFSAAPHRAGSKVVSRQNELGNALQSLNFTLGDAVSGCMFIHTECRSYGAGAVVGNSPFLAQCLELTVFSLPTMEG